MLAARVGEVLGPVERLVGLRGQGVARDAADASKVAHVHYRDSIVGRVQSARVDSQVQRVDVVVDFEGLREAAQTDAALEQLAGTDDPGPTQSPKLGPRGRHGIEQIRPVGRGRRQLSSLRRGRLQAVAKEVSSRDGMILVDLVVDLQRKPVHAVGGRGRHRQSVPLGVGIDGKKLQQVLTRRVRAESEAGDARSRGKHFTLSGGDRNVRRLGAQPLRFVAHKEEGPVFHDRSSRYASKLLVPERRTVRRKEVPSVRRVRVAEVIGGAVQVVPAALHHHVDHGAAFYPEFGRGKLLDHKLLSGVDRDQRRRNAHHPGLVQDRIAVEAVVVRNAIHQEVVGGAPHAVDVDGQETAAGHALNARNDSKQGIDVAAADRQIGDSVLIDEGVQAVLGDFDERGRC